MRRIKPILFSLAISCAVELEATMPVIDYSAIYNQLVTSRRDLTQQLMQVKNQREQILQVTSQIRANALKGSTGCSLSVHQV